MLADRDGAHPHVFSVSLVFFRLLLRFCHGGIRAAHSSRPEEENPGGEPAFAVEDALKRWWPGGCRRLITQRQAGTIDQWCWRRTPREGNFDWCPLGKWPPNVEASVESIGQDLAALSAAAGRQVI